MARATYSRLDGTLTVTATLYVLAQHPARLLTRLTQHSSEDTRQARAREDDVGMSSEQKHRGAAQRLILPPLYTVDDPCCRRRRGAAVLPVI